MLIADLIKEHETAQAEAKQAQARQLDETGEQLETRLLQEVNKHLPDLLKYMCRTPTVVASNGNADYIYTPVNVPDLVKFYVKGKFQRDPASCNPEEDPGMTVVLCSKNPNQANYHSGLRSVDITMREAVASFLYDRRQDQVEMDQKEQKHLVEWANIRLGEDHQGYAGGSIVTRAKTPDEAREAYELLQTTVPPGTDLDEWKTKTRNRYDAWLKRYEQAREQERQREKEQRRQKEKLLQVCDFYQTAYEAWLRAFIPIAKSNLEILKDLQDEFAEPFEIVSLERGIVASDEGERWIDTDTVIVIPWPGEEAVQSRVFDDAGCVQLLRHQRGAAKKWFIDRERVVGIEAAARTITPGGEWGLKVYPDWNYFNNENVQLANDYERTAVFCSPLRPAAEVNYAIECRLTKPPIPPDTEGLTDYQAGQIRAEVDALVAPEFGLVRYSNGNYGLGEGLA